LWPKPKEAGLEADAMEDDPGANTPQSEISRAAVTVLREYTGRGPTAAHTTIDGDVVVVILSDRLSETENALVNAGMREEVLRGRQEFQRMMRHKLVEAVEGTLSRGVTAFMCDNHIAPDIAAEVFLLEPELESRVR
jgi:uncharacterized protein YbcI